jgi:hypothetical protein
MSRKSKKEKKPDTLDDETLMTEFDYEEEMARARKIPLRKRIVRKAKKAGRALVKKFKKAPKKE